MASPDGLELGAVTPQSSKRQTTAGTARWVGVAVAAVAMVAVIAVISGSDSRGQGPVSASAAAVSQLTMSKEQADKMFKNTPDFKDYPSWTKDVDAINEQGRVNHGVWTYYKGPPFLQRVTLYSGNDVDITHAGNMIRRILGLPKNFGKWEGNTYLNTFDSQQMRFLQDNKHSVLVMPPLAESNVPLLSIAAKAMLHKYISTGHNTVIVTGGPASIDFINQNFLGGNPGGQLLEPAWTRGPYEKQESTIGTPFQTAPVTMPNDLNHVHGARLQSLPQEAVSYYETNGVSVVFSVAMGHGQLLYVGFDYSLMSKPWVKTLIAGMEFAS
mmetsp:Transcript_18101/g.40698  ORF Transcript_18101/g.40698 Transcript_18101/m.40698 type:complete len:327 (-) Transcript_18101:35-1015(-)